MGLLESFTPPPGSPDAVRDGARCWREVADRLDRRADEVEQRSLSLSASWGGPAKEAYERQVTPFLDAVRQGAGNLRDGAGRLDEVAARIEEAQNRYRQAMIAAGITVGIGIALTVFTFGGSDAAAAAAVSAEVGAAMEISAVAAAEATSALSMLGSFAAQLAGRFAIFTLTGVAADGAAGMVAYGDANPFDHLHLAEDLEFGAIGAVAAPIGRALTAGAARVAGGELLRGGAGIATSAAVDGLSLSSADALVRGLLGQEIDPRELGVVAVTGAAGSAVARGGAGLSRLGAGRGMDVPPDVGLSGRGLRPEPGTRTTTREQWRAEQSRLRAERTTAAADQPLENPSPNAPTQGHGHARHGWQTTDEQQKARVAKGVAPNGDQARVGRASRFRSPQAEAEALGRARGELERRLRAFEVPYFEDTSSGGRVYAHPVTGEPVRVRILVVTSDPAGFADSTWLGRRVDGPTSGFQLDEDGFRLVDHLAHVEKRALVSFEYVRSADEWRVATYFPGE